MSAREKDSTTKIVRQLRSGQITIPIEFRRELGIDETTLLEATLSDGVITLRKVDAVPSTAGSPWLRELHDYFAPLREEILERGISQEELFADIDEAVAQSRAARRQRMTKAS